MSNHKSVNSDTVRRFAGGGVLSESWFGFSSFVKGIRVVGFLDFVIVIKPL